MEIYFCLIITLFYILRVSFTLQIHVCVFENSICTYVLPKHHFKENIANFNRHTYKKKNHHSHVIYCIFLFRLCIKVDRIKIENLTPILEAAPVDLDPDCRTPFSGGICDLLLYFRRVLNGIVLLFYVLIYKNFLRKYDPKCMYLQTLSLFEGYSLSPLLTITIFEYRY